MQKIVLEIEKDEVVDKILWMLEHFQSDELKITYDKKRASRGAEILINIAKCQETFSQIESQDFSQIKTIKSLNEHFRELGI